ncbi:MAG: hypothetical protein WCC11_05065 [Gammaproteobacteria bacterium]
MLATHEYLGKIAHLYEKFTGRTAAGHSYRKEIDQLERNSMEFASANLRHLLPDIPIEEHAGIIDEILFNRDCSDLDEDSFFLLKSTTISDPGSILIAAKEKPVIFCTFHYGSYRLINPLLMSRGFNYILPVEDKIYATQTARYMENHAGCQKYFNSTSQFLVVNAEESTAALTMARKARAGWSLLAYIDGNTGVQGAGRRDAKMVRVPLLGKPIYARKGIAFLSHFLKMPIVPVICEITGPMERTITFHDKIEPFADGEDREAYCRMATEKLYAILGAYLEKNPSQWLGWLELQKYLDTDGLSNDEPSDKQDAHSVSLADNHVDHKLMFNHRRFGFIVQDDERVLLDKATYKLLSLPPPIIQILDSYREPARISATDASPEQMDVIRQLVSMSMLSVIPQ